ncbi:cycloartenol synthase-like protein [Candidatus Magnetomorum sp. HK-1]|nr:cycloartenol synthase-like protein [Candidatus Magnetomorum sp. HK-1]
MKLYKYIVFLILIAIPTFCIANQKPVKIQIKQQINLSLFKETQHSLKIASEYLLNNQLPNGSWKDHPAITALVIYSFIIHPSTISDKKADQAIEKGLKYIESFVQKDGGIYRKEYRNYVTAVCLMAFTETQLKKYSTIVTNAKNFLIKFQLDEDEDISTDHPYYGGIGYGGDDRPDLSNTQLALEAIKSAEEYESSFKQMIPKTPQQIEKEEKELGLHWKKALVFLARCQNVKAINKMPYASDDGGFIYETGTYKKERSHSYGSMTYAGVKSLVYAKVNHSDIRMKKAISWIQKNYTLDINPGFNDTSLYYYYMTFSKCLHALGENQIVDSKKVSHNWREDIVKKLLELQKGDGYWVNSNGRFWENIKVLTTAYAVIGIKFATID